METLDYLESLENAVEKRYDEMLQSDGRLKCSCGRLFNALDGQALSQNPYADLYCPDCVDKWMLEQQNRREMKYKQCVIKTHSQRESMAVLGHAASLGYLGEIEYSDRALFLWGCGQICNGFEDESEHYIPITVADFLALNREDVIEEGE